MNFSKCNEGENDDDDDDDDVRERTFKILSAILCNYINPWYIYDDDDDMMIIMMVY